MTSLRTVAVTREPTRIQLANKAVELSVQAAKAWRGDRVIEQKHGKALIVACSTVAGAEVIHSAFVKLKQENRDLKPGADATWAGSDGAIHGVVRWRLIDLCQWLWESSVSLSVARQTLSRELRALGRMPEHRPGEPTAASGFCHGLNASSTPIGARRQGRRGGEQLALGIRFSLGRDRGEAGWM